MAKSAEQIDVGDVSAKGADPSAIARRVESIVDLLQIMGVFKRFPSPVEADAEHVTAYFAKPRARAEMVNENEVVVGLDFQFRASRDSNGLPTTTDWLVPDEQNLADLRVIVEAQYLIRYRLSDGPLPSVGELNRFAEVNGPLNVVPFWREFLDSALRRAGMPPAMAPVHKAEPIVKSDEKSHRTPE